MLGKSPIEVEDIKDYTDSNDNNNFIASIYLLNCNIIYIYIYIILIHFNSFSHKIYPAGGTYASYSI